MRSFGPILARLLFLTCLVLSNPVVCDESLRNPAFLSDDSRVLSLGSYQLHFKKQNIHEWLFSVAQQVALPVAMTLPGHLTLLGIRYDCTAMASLANAARAVMSLGLQYWAVSSLATTAEVIGTDIYTLLKLAVLGESELEIAASRSLDIYKDQSGTTHIKVPTYLYRPDEILSTCLAIEQVSGVKLIKLDKLPFRPFGELGDRAANWLARIHFNQVMNYFSAAGEQPFSSEPAGIHSVLLPFGGSFKVRTAMNNGQRTGSRSSGNARSDSQRGSRSSRYSSSMWGRNSWGDSAGGGGRRPPRKPWGYLPREPKSLPEWESLRYPAHKHKQKQKTAWMFPGYASKPVQVRSKPLNPLAAEFHSERLMAGNTVPNVADEMQQEWKFPPGKIIALTDDDQQAIATLKKVISVASPGSVTLYGSQALRAQLFNLYDNYAEIFPVDWDFTVSRESYFKILGALGFTSQQIEKSSKNKQAELISLRGENLNLAMTRNVQEGVFDSTSVRVLRESKLVIKLDFTLSDQQPEGESLYFEGIGSVRTVAVDFILTKAEEMKTSSLSNPHSAQSFQKHSGKLKKWLALEEASEGAPKLSEHNLQRLKKLVQSEPVLLSKSLPVVIPEASEVKETLSVRGKIPDPVLPGQLSMKSEENSAEPVLSEMLPLPAVFKHLSDHEFDRVIYSAVVDYQSRHPDSFIALAGGRAVWWHIAEQLAEDDFTVVRGQWPARGGDWNFAVKDRESAHSLSSAIYRAIQLHDGYGSVLLEDLPKGSDVLYKKVTRNRKPVAHYSMQIENAREKWLKERMTGGKLDILTPPVLFREVSMQIHFIKHYQRVNGWIYDWVLGKLTALQGRQKLLIKYFPEVVEVKTERTELTASGGNSLSSSTERALPSSVKTELKTELKSVTPDVSGALEILLAGVTPQMDDLIVSANEKKGVNIRPFPEQQSSEHQFSEIALVHEMTQMNLDASEDDGDKFVEQIASSDKNQSVEPDITPQPYDDLKAVYEEEVVAKNTRKKNRRKVRQRISSCLEDTGDQGNEAAFLVLDQVSDSEVWDVIEPFLETLTAADLLRLEPLIWKAAETRPEALLWLIEQHMEGKLFRPTWLRRLFSQHYTEQGIASAPEFERNFRNKRVKHQPEHIDRLSEQPAFKMLDRKLQTMLRSAFIPAAQADNWQSSTRQWLDKIEASMAALDTRRLVAISVSSSLIEDLTLPVDRELLELESFDSRSQKELAVAGKFLTLYRELESWLYASAPESSKGIKPALSTMAQWLTNSQRMALVAAMARFPETTSESIQLLEQFEGSQFAQLASVGQCLNCNSLSFPYQIIGHSAALKDTFPGSNCDDPLGGRCLCIQCHDCITTCSCCNIPLDKFKDRSRRRELLGALPAQFGKPSFHGLSGVLLTEAFKLTESGYFHLALALVEQVLASEGISPSPETSHNRRMQWFIQQEFGNDEIRLNQFYDILRTSDCWSSFLP